MTTPHQPYESLRERARRVLMDNPPPPPRAPAGAKEVAPADPEPAGGAPRSLFDQGPALPLGATPLPVLSPEGHPESGQPNMPYQPQAPAGQPTTVYQPQAPPGQPNMAYQSQAPAGPDQAESPPQPQDSVVPAEQSPQSDEILLLVQERLRAIRVVQDLLPKQMCSSQRVHELSQSLAGTSGDSVYYRPILDRLRAAHEEWLELEEQLWAADHVVRSTQWVVELLSEPARRVNGTRGTPAHS